MFKNLIKFIKDVKQEMKYVTWPTKADIKEGTVVVITMSAIVAIFLSGVDAIFSMVIQFILLKG
jgi:preprotein translocase subunit SecE